MNQSLQHTRALLANLRGKLRTFAWQQELGWALFAGSVWWLVSYAMDAVLHLPAPLRVFHTLVLVALPTWFLARRLVRHLRNVPTETGLAVLAERGQANNEDLLVTAVQLSQGPDAQNPGVQEIMARAEKRAQELQLEPVLDPRPARLSLVRGVAGVAGLAAVYFATQATADIYIARMLGADIPWPQETYLDIEVPGRADRMFVERTGDEIHVRIARGSDLPVLVRASGEIPDQVSLVFDHGHQSTLDSGGSDLFRTQLRSVQQDVVFYAKGGDDSDRRPTVTVEVLDPPDVADLAFLIKPPPYSGLPERLERSTDISVLAQSDVEVFVLPDPIDVVGQAHLLPEGGLVSLEPKPFPGVEGAQTGGLSMAWKAEDSIRLRFELKGSRGLLNPDPGLYAVQVLPDRRPGITLLAPSRVDTEVVVGGLLPLRIRATDDFGLSPLRLNVRRMQEDASPVYAETLDLRELPIGAEVDEGTLSLMAHNLIPIEAFLPEGLTDDSQVLTLQVEVDDNRSPELQTTKSSIVRVRVVAADEYLRKLESRLAQAGDSANKLTAIMERVKTSLSQMQAALQDAPGETQGLDLTDPLFDVQKLSGDARELGRDLAGLTENLLYNRIDPRAQTLLSAMDDFQARQFERAFHPAPWRALADGHANGRYGQPDLAGDLLTLVGLALQLSEDQLPELGATLENSDGAPPADALALAHIQAQEAARTIEALLTQLGEWDNFQSVLTHTRDIIKRQRNLHERTRKFAKDK